MEESRWVHMTWADKVDKDSMDSVRLLGSRGILVDKDSRDCKVDKEEAGN
jgi:hypothetical protein